MPPGPRRSERSRSRRRAGSERSLQRREGTLSGDLVLIVCEGEKTEPQYFEGLRTEWQLRSSDVEIVGRDCGAAPISVVDYAIRVREERKDRRPYDEVWCVFDCDKHQSLKRALDKAEANGLRVALSVPCFEFWFVLHYHYTARPFSDCRAVIRDLKRYIKGYGKGTVPPDLLLSKLNPALKNAERLRKDSEVTGRRNPGTNVDKVVRKLMSMTRRRQ